MTKSECTHAIEIQTEAGLWRCQCGKRVGNAAARAYEQAARAPMNEQAIMQQLMALLEQRGRDLFTRCGHEPTLIVPVRHEPTGSYQLHFACVTCGAYHAQQMELPNMPQCMHCGILECARELRPYGAQGRPVCFPCSQATPERRAEADRQLSAAFHLAGPRPVSFSARGIVAIEELTEAELCELACTRCGRAGFMSRQGCGACGAEVGAS